VLWIEHGAFSFSLFLGLHRRYVLRCRTFLPLDHFELDLLSFPQRLEAFRLNGAVVDKNIIAAIALDEAKTF
jgi:hypothetical protein